MAFNIDLTNTLRNPGSDFSVGSQGKTFPTVGLGTEESNILNEQLNQLMVEQESSVLGPLIANRETAIAKTAAFSKQVFDEKRFGGLNAQDNEIGFSPIRPGHIRSDPATGNAENDWFYTPSSEGWNDWIGDGAANNYTAGEDQVSVIFGLVDHEPSSEITGVNVDAFGRNVDMLPVDTTQMTLGDNKNEVQVASLPTLILQENDDVHIRLRADRTVESKPRLMGFTFGLGTFLNTEDY